MAADLLRPPLPFKVMESGPAVVLGREVGADGNPCIVIIPPFNLVVLDRFVLNSVVLFRNFVGDQKVQGAVFAVGSTARPPSWLCTRIRSPGPLHLEVSDLPLSLDAE